MGGANRAKQLLKKYNQEQYRLFTLNNDEQISLTVVSSVPGVGASKRKDIYKKTISHPDSDQHLKFITKNNEAHCFVWQTKPQQLKNAVRWGIIKTHSITSKVIAALGNYRVTAHQRIARGMISNSQLVKLRLLDLYQDRFEALQNLESLANKNSSAADYEREIRLYLEKLTRIKSQLDGYFADVPDLSGIDPDTLEQIKNDLQADEERVISYLNSISNKSSLSSYNDARGQNSILEFVKQQMTYGLYELQGINQDLTFSLKRDFALTRGEMNDFIEDARKEIDDHQADLSNAVTEKHHGLFAHDDESLLTYDFSAENLSSKREREVLLALSFIEGWDQVDEQSLTVKNKYGSESLDVINATKWKTHRNVTALAKSVGYFILNFFKSIFLPTQPWKEEPWENNNFHLIATELGQHAAPNEPMWEKPVRLFKQIGYALSDAFSGVSDIGTQLTVKLPDKILNDWDSTNELQSLSDVLQGAEKEIISINTTEEIRLNAILKQCRIYNPEHEVSPATSTLATVEYELTAGDQNDILTVMARGLTEFTSVLTHNLYTKDPVAGMVFSSAFAVGASAICFPETTGAIFGTSYVNCFTQFAYSVGSSKTAAILSGAGTQAQLFAGGWDSLIHGPSGIATNALYRLGEDPLTTASYAATATAIGYLLVNGVGGYTIPWLSALLQEDLGTSPESSYPFIGAKVAILLYEALHIHHERHYPQPEISAELMNLAQLLKSVNSEQQRIIDRFVLASWLSKNEDTLPKLNDKHRFDVSRHIKLLFTPQESKSLNKLLYPEASHSIAFQVFSIPLAYIPAILRFVFSFILTGVALAYDKAHPFEPVKRASGNLYNKTVKDLSRLLVFGSHLIYLPYMAFSAVIKAASYVCIMAVGRIAAFFDIKTAHAIHQSFARIHTFFKSIGDFIYPAAILKSVSIAHPTHTINQVGAEFIGSYSKLLLQMERENAGALEDAGREINPRHTPFALSSKDDFKPEYAPVNDESAAHTMKVQFT